ncbi:MAG: hypothetical protein PHQ53_10780 [Candidatus Krumholzibacteria bacterium]|nr:hypothetical protein [Candidatus Krumholzibacteria bacterium]
MALNLVIWALGWSTAVAQISIVEIQRNTECLVIDTGEAVDEELWGPGQWTSSINLDNVGSALAVQETNIQLDGAFMNSGGSLRAVAEMTQEQGTDHLYSWSRITSAVVVAEETEYAFTVSMSAGVHAILLVPGNSTALDEPGEYNLEGLLQAGDQIQVYIEATVDAQLEGIDSVEAAAIFDFSLTPTSVDTRVEDWSSVKTMYR